MTTQAYSTLNGIAPSWADASISFDVYSGQTLDDPDLKNLSIKDDVEVGFQMAGGRIIATTSGQYKPDVSMQLYRSGWRKFAKILIPMAPIVRGNQKAISLVHFSILYRCTPPGDDVIYQVKVKGCRLIGRSFPMAEGPDADVVDLPITCKEVVEIYDGQEIVLI